MNKVFVVFAFITLGLSQSGCKFTPDFDNTPKITFKNLTLFRDEAKKDSIIMSIEYQDGDGDLGLEAIDRIREDSAFSQRKKNGDINYSFNNLRINLYVKRGGGNYELVKFTDPGASVYGFDNTFPPFIDRNNITPIKGTLQFYKLLIPGVALTAQVGDTLHYTIQIEDRQSHMSNIVTTTDFIF